MGLKRLRARLRPQPTQLPTRIYAIGDIHGRFDLLTDLIDRVESDCQARGVVPTTLVILGDIIDRGPGSAQLIELLMQLQSEPNIVVLLGNHEAAMLAALDGDHDALDLWLAHGGDATLMSYGSDIGTVDRDDTRTLLRLARAAIPPAVVAWLRTLPTHLHLGDHYFVHAGIRPGIALDEQTDEDRLWIREDFTGSDADHGVVIVHGHSVDERGVVEMPNRIGVDTGAYRTGRLSAVGLEAGQRWTVTARIEQAAVQ